MCKIVSQGPCSSSLEKQKLWEQVWGVWKFDVWKHMIANFLEFANVLEFAVKEPLKSTTNYIQTTETTMFTNLSAIYSGLNAVIIEFNSNALR